MEIDRQRICGRAGASSENGVTFTVPRRLHDRSNLTRSRLREIARCCFNDHEKQVPGYPV